MAAKDISQIRLKFRTPYLPFIRSYNIITGNNIVQTHRPKNMKRSIFSNDKISSNSLE